MSEQLRSFAKDRVYRSLKDLDLDPVRCQPLELRLVHVKLSTGEVEVLLITLTTVLKFSARSDRKAILYSFALSVKPKMPRRNSV